MRDTLSSPSRLRPPFPFSPLRTPLSPPTRATGRGITQLTTDNHSLSVLTFSRLPLPNTRYNTPSALREMAYREGWPRVWGYRVQGFGFAKRGAGSWEARLAILLTYAANILLANALAQNQLLSWFNRFSRAGLTCAPNPANYGVKLGVIPPLFALKAFDWSKNCPK